MLLGGAEPRPHGLRGEYGGDSFPGHGMVEMFSLFEVRNLKFDGTRNGGGTVPYDLLGKYRSNL